MRRLVGDGFPLAFDANNGYSTGGAIRVGRALEELGYWWFEEPVQHYHVKAMGEVARALDITVSAGEQTYTLAGLADLIAAGVRMVQPDIVKMGGITGLMRCAALAQAHGVELVPHQTQPTIGHMANLHVAASQLHATKPCELNDPSPRMHAVFENPPMPVGRAVPSAGRAGAGAARQRGGTGETQSGVVTMAADDTRIIETAFEDRVMGTCSRFSPRAIYSPGEPEAAAAARFRRGHLGAPGAGGRARCRQGGINATAAAAESRCGRARPAPAGWATGGAADPGRETSGPCPISVSRAVCRRELRKPGRGRTPASAPPGRAP